MLAKNHNVLTWLLTNTSSTSKRPPSFAKKDDNWGITSSSIVAAKDLATAFPAFFPPPAAAALGAEGLGAGLGLGLELLTGSLGAAGTSDVVAGMLASTFGTSAFASFADA